VEEIAQVYSRALFEVAKENEVLDEVHEQLDEFVDALEDEDNRELRLFFFSPYFSSEEKKKGVERVVSGADERFLNFLKLLAERHRMPVLPRIRRQFQSRWSEEKQLLPVSVTSAVDLDEELVKGIGDRIEEQTGRTVDLSSQVDPEVLGGLVVRVGNMVMDASVRSRLEKIRKQVLKAA
jgi:F-type H+-transporting ATPase subunit delta